MKEETPAQQVDERCHNCQTPLRERAAFCDRCGASQVTKSGSLSPPWSLVVILALSFGSLLGYVVARLLPDPELSSVPVQKSLGKTPAVVPTDTLIAQESPPVRVPIDIEVEPISPPKEVPEEDSVDLSSEGVRQAFGAAVVDVQANDTNGKPGPEFLGAVVGANQIIVPYSAIELAAGAIIHTNTGARRIATGILQYDRSYDLALLAVDPPFPEPWLFPSDSDETELVLLGPPSNTRWIATELSLGPGGSDPLSGGPRFTINMEAPFGGAMVDRNGNVVALVPRPASHAIACFPASHWLTENTVPVSFEDVIRMAGPPSPASLLRLARKLVAEHRYHEGAQTFVQAVIQNPGLLPETREELALATLNAANENIAAGNGIAAVNIITETQTVLPNESELWAARARAHALESQVNAAIEAFLTAASLDPGQKAAWLREARETILDEANRLRRTGFHAEALALLLNYRKDLPNDGLLRLTAGQLLMEVRRFGDAAILFEEAGQLDVTVALEARAAAKRARDLAGGPGTIAIDYPPGSRAHVVTAVINGGGSLSMLLDQASPATIIPEAFAEQVGYKLSRQVRVGFPGRPGEPEVPGVELNSVSVNGVAIGNIAAIVSDNRGSGQAAGVLGASYLSRFRVVDDRDLGRLVLYPR